MTTPTSTRRDPAIGRNTDLPADPSSPSTDTEDKATLATTNKPVLVQVNHNIFEHYKNLDWMRDFKPDAPAATTPTPTPASATAAATVSLQPSSQPVVEKSDRAAITKEKANTGECEEAFPRPRPSFTMHNLISRPAMNGFIPIRVCIGNIPLDDLPTDEGWFPAILDVINRYTIQKPYVCDKSQLLDVGDAIVFRPIHNVTHSIRQARLLQTLIDCLSIHGSSRVTKILEALSPTERLLMKLGSFCLRVGRVDETNTNHSIPDSNGRKERSAQIFSLYASQLPDTVAPRDQISWVASLISVACTPEEALPKAITDNEKSYFGVQLLACAHELDLYRCYNKTAMLEVIEKIKQFLFIQTDDLAKSIQFQSQLETYALALIAATGSAIQYQNKNYNLSVFGENSLDAKYCWQTTGRVEQPSW